MIHIFSIMHHCRISKKILNYTNKHVMFGIILMRMIQGIEFCVYKFGILNFFNLILYFSILSALQHNQMLQIPFYQSHRI